PRGTSRAPRRNRSCARGRCPPRRASSRTPFRGPSARTQGCSTERGGVRRRRSPACAFAFVRLAQRSSARGGSPAENGAGPSPGQGSNARTNGGFDIPPPPPPPPPPPRRPSWPRPPSNDPHAPPHVLVTHSNTWSTCAAPFGLARPHAKRH